MASEKKQKEEKSVIVPRSSADIQRFKLEKLMKNPNKPVQIPEKPGAKLPRVFNPPEFVRNIWGSSAGAGSGDFHVYRGVRRREYARQKFMTEKAKNDEADVIYHKKVEENMKEAEMITSKKRAKRLKKKWKQKQAKKKKTDDKGKQKTEESESDSEEEVDNQQVMAQNTEESMGEPTTDDPMEKHNQNEAGKSDKPKQFTEKDKDIYHEKSGCDRQNIQIDSDNID